MSSLAAILLEAGESVSGCDLATNAWTDLLASKGARVLQGHSTEHLAGATRLVVTGPAMRSDEVARARELGLPVLRRAEMLGKLMDDRRGVAVAGTHGKTTTTSLLASILVAGGVDPSVLIGGVPAGWELGGRFGHGEWFLAEADEYDRSFHLMHPDLAIVTSIEMDHPDIYADLLDVKDSFETFLRGMRARGTLLVHLGDAVAMEVARRAAAASGTALLTYGLTSDADWYAKVESGSSRFAFHGPGETLSDLRAPLPGDHNLCNAVAAAAAARLIGVSNEALRESLEAFRGVGRRWEIKGESRGVLVVDDYAHHPGALEATLRNARVQYPEREVWVAFQPHTYSRTRELLHEFADALRLADRVYVLDVYAAREAPDPGVSGERLAVLVPGAMYAGGVGEAARRISADVTAEVVLLTVGAGDVTMLGPMVLAQVAAGDGR